MTTLTETEWQRTLVGALNTFGWHHMHVRRTVGRGKQWTTSTSAKGWPDLVALRGPWLVAIEVKTDVGKITPEQIEWLHRFSLLAGGRAWVIRPGDDWDTIVGWLRNPADAPRCHGWQSPIDAR